MITRQNIKKESTIIKIKIAVFVLFLWVTTSAFASWAPLQDVEAGKETIGSTTTIWYKVFDPVLNEWKEGSQSYNGYSIELTNTDGVVAWLASKSGNYRIGYAVYDPGRGQWIEDSRSYSSFSQPEAGYSVSHSVSQLRNDDGVICWLDRSTYNYDWGSLKSWNVIYTIYEPELGVWQLSSSGHSEMDEESFSESYSNFQLKTKDGVSSWTAIHTIDYGGGIISRFYIVKYVLYDPANQSWQEGNESYSNSISSLSIQNATVHYSVDGTDYTRGYDASVVSWYDGFTKPLAFFAAVPSLGYVPLNVWFTDMSISATSWDWDFGDGENSPERSPLHIFSISGEFTVTQTVTGLQGSDSTTSIIVTDPNLVTQLGQAFSPSPANGTIDVHPHAILSWFPGDFTDKHNVYFGTVFDDVEMANTENPLGVLVSHLQDANTYEPNLLEFDQTYYWRVDEVTAPPESVVFRGNVWSFSTMKAIDKIIYVDMNAVGANDGSSWADAYKYLQDALSDATVLKDIGTVEIRVAQGVYTPDRNTTFPEGTGNRLATFQLISGVPIRGGYAGFGAPDPNDRDIIAHESILSGDLSGNDIDVNDPKKLWHEPTRNENSYRVVTSDETNQTTVLDGFIITAGFADGGLYYRYGGGMSNNGKPTLSNCIFIGNYSRSNGGGMYNSGDPNLTNCTFSNNSSSSSGGGMYNSGDPNLTNCTFSNNSSSGGGGMYNRRGDPDLNNCTFSDNSASIYDGGGMDNAYYSNSPTLTNCTFSNNSARNGGGMSNLNGAFGYPAFTNCTFSNNFANEDGGGMFSVGYPNLTNCTFSRNLAYGDGGGMYNFNGTFGYPAFTNCTFSGNLAYEGGGGIYSGSQLYNYPAFTNCTFSGNLAYDGGGLYYRGKTILTNCILWNNIPNQIPFSEHCVVSYSNIQDGWPGESNIDLDPLFVSPGYWDPNGTPEDPDDDFWVNGNYHLKSQAGRWDPVSKTWLMDDVTSPCIDAGDPNSPVGDEPEPNSGRINMGAYGGTAEASKSN